MTQEGSSYRASKEIKGITVTEPEPMSRTAAIAYAIGLPLALVALVFIPGGRLNWPPGWFFIGFLVAIYGASALILSRVNPAIYRARSAGINPASHSCTWSANI